MFTYCHKEDLIITSKKKILNLGVMSILLG